MAIGLKKGLAYIMIANLINLVIGLMNGFVLPRFLSVETYAMIKTFTLYSTYAGIFHLGYLDGMYLKYGGKDIRDVSATEYGSDFKNVSLFQMIVALIVLFIGVILNSFVLISFAIVLFFKNITSCYQMFFQATGEFKLYSSALNYGSIISFVLSILLIFVFRTDNYKLYISAQVISTIIVSVYLAILLNKRLPYLTGASLSKRGFVENIRSGFVLMIGNFSNNLFTSIDRWFVKILMTTFHFAAYSFAVSIDALITVFITPLYVTLYNAFCKDYSSNRIINIKRLVMMWGGVMIAFAFPAKYVVEHYLAKYEASIPLIFILFSTQVFYAVIKGVYVNYYKALKQQNQYFWQIILMLIIAAISSLILYFIFKTMMSLAVAALVTAIIWLIINEYQHKDLRFSKKDWAFLVMLIAIYLYCGLILDTIIGFIVYTISIIILSWTLLNTQSRWIIKLLQNTIHDLKINRLNMPHNNE